MKFLITAGPTVEPIDSVRFLSNYSSGKMGYALALAARSRGYPVTLVSGPTSLAPPRGTKFVPVATAREMRLAVLKNFRKADVIIKTAAVADYRPARKIHGKTKKKKKVMTLRLVQNPDILKELGTKKKPGQILVGFAAESGNKIRNAVRKLKEKNCDWMIFNNISKKGTGFASDYNKVTLVSRKGEIIPLKKARKTRLAGQIIDILLEGL